MTREEVLEAIKGERTRLSHAIHRMNATMNSLADSIILKEMMPSMEEGQSVVQAALEIAVTLARMFAYGRMLR